MSVTPPLMTRSTGYKPFRYPWAYEAWKRHEQIHWLAEEVPLHDDVKDWAVRLTPAERNLLTQIFRLFTKSDEEVGNNYMTRIGGLFLPTEVQMMLSSFGAREGVHVDAYSLLLETIGMPDAEYEAFAQYEAMAAKDAHWQTFNTDTPADVLRTLAMFGAFAEGLQVFAMFAMLMNFPRLGKMKGMGQIVSWSVRDESLHCEGIIRLFHAYAEESGALTPSVRDDIVQCCADVVAMEDKFIDLAFEMGGVEGMEPGDIKAYIRFIADWRLRQLGLPEMFGVKENPLPWLQSMLSGIEHANFFEARATEYSKAATSGDWGKTWERFDERNRVDEPTLLP